METSLALTLEPIISRVRTDITAVKTSAGIGWRKNEPLSQERLKDHLEGRAYRGVCPIKENENTTRLALLDLDSHKQETSWEDMKAVAIKVIVKLRGYGLQPIPFRSSGGHGIHLFMIWDEPQDAYSIRQTLRQILNELGCSDGTQGVGRQQIEIFPKQDNVPLSGCGNMFILPLAGKSVPLDFDKKLEPMPREAMTSLLWPLSLHVQRQYRPALRSPSLNNESSSDVDLEEIRDQLRFIDPECNRDRWIRIGMALHFETSADPMGLALWDEWSRGELWQNGEAMPSSYVDLGDLEYQWNKFKKM